MAKGNRSSRKPADRGEKQAAAPVSSEAPADPLNAFPADPPQQNWLLLVGSAVLFAVWFCYLAYVALRS